MEVSYRNRPYKISNCGKQFKGVVAANLSELKDKSIRSFQLETVSDHVNVYLAEDETLVDDQDYFATIPENTKLLIKEKSLETSLDSVDGVHHEVSESQEFSSHSGVISEDIVIKLKQLGPTNSIMGVLSMSNSELEVLSNLSLPVLIEELGFDSGVARVFQDTVGKELMRRNDLEDATNLLKLYDRAKSTMDKTDNGKRKKI